MSRSAMTSALAAIAVLGGCGGASSDSEQMRAVAQRYVAALARGDGRALCSSLTAEAQRELATIAERIEVAPKPRGCVGLGDFLRVLATRKRQAASRLGDARIGKAKVAGTTGTVQIEEPGGSAKRLALRKTAAGWKVTLTPAFDLAGEDVIPAEPPAQLGAVGAAQFELGRSVTARSGCLACHRIDEDGNAGPGGDLTHIGTARSPAAIESAIVNATPPMPSFRRLPKAELRALVTFLSQLR